MINLVKYFQYGKIMKIWVEENGTRYFYKAKTQDVNEAMSWINGVHGYCKTIEATVKANHPQMPVFILIGGTRFEIELPLKGRKIKSIFDGAKKGIDVIIKDYITSIKQKYA